MAAPAHLVLTLRFVFSPPLQLCELVRLRTKNRHVTCL